MPDSRGEWTQSELDGFVINTLIAAADAGRQFVGWALESGGPGPAKVMVGKGDYDTIILNRRFYVGDYIFSDDLAAAKPATA